MRNPTLLARSLILTIWSGYFYFGTEWLFFATKPSALSLLPIVEQISVLLVAPLVLLAPALSIQLLAVLPGALLKRDGEFGLAFGSEADIRDLSDLDPRQPDGCPGQKPADGSECCRDLDPPFEQLLFLPHQNHEQKKDYHGNQDEESNDQLGSAGTFIHAMTSIDSLPGELTRTF